MHYCLNQFDIGFLLQAVKCLSYTNAKLYQALFQTLEIVSVNRQGPCSQDAYIPQEDDRALANK